MGKFKTRFHIQAGFELICRIYRIASLRKLFMRRILTDYEYRLPQSKWIVRQLFETIQIIFIYYGLTQALFSLVLPECAPLLSLVEPQHQGSLLERARGCLNWVAPKVSSL